MTRTTWTPEMDVELTRMIMDGVTSTRIGETMGMSRSAVMGRATRMGVPFKNNRPNGKAWTPALDAQVKELVAQGLTLLEVGEKIGRSRDSIKTRVGKLALHVPIKRANQHRNANICAPKASREESLEVVKAIKSEGSELMLEDLKDAQCRFPVDDVSPFHFCGRPKKYGVYCEAHWVVTRQPSQLSRL